MKDVYFMPLGGGQNVGNSSYFLRLGNNNIILDAGKGFTGSWTYGPDFLNVCETPFVESLGQINQIFISHAHMDHVGSLPYLMDLAPHAQVYMTSATKALTRYQLEKELGRLADFDSDIVEVSYMQKLDFGDYKVTFYPAGHVPGAMMILFEYQGKQILYTGDFTSTATPLADSCWLPEKLQPDIVILCGLHAASLGTGSGMEQLTKYLDTIYQNMCRGHSVHIKANQLSKGIEFLKYLNMVNQQNGWGYSVVIDKHLLEIVRQIEKVGIPVLNEYNYTDSRLYQEIFFGKDKLTDRNKDYITINVDFTLHDSYFQTLAFMKKLNPHKCYIVHCDGIAGETIEQKLMLDADCRTQFEFAENGVLYCM